MTNPYYVVFTLFFLSATAIELPLKPGEFICTAIMSSFDPIKIDIKFPSLPDRLEGENFKVVIKSLSNSDILYESYITPGTILRNSLEIEKNIIHELCITLQYERNFPEETIFYIPFTQTEDFQSLIGHIQIPEQLAKQETLKEIYLTSKKIENFNKIIASHQLKQRDLEDQISTKNLYKAQRIISISLLECFVIIVSGVYQVYALRKFLIQKNLY